MRPRIDETTRRRRKTDLLTDLENARRFADEHRGDIHYVSKWRQWIVWDKKRWGRDDTSEVQRRAKATVQAMYEAASKIKDRDKREKQLKYALAAQRANRIAAMIELATSGGNAHEGR